MDAVAQYNQQRWEALVPAYTLVVFTPRTRLPSLWAGRLVDQAGVAPDVDDVVTVWDWLRLAASRD